MNCKLCDENLKEERRRHLILSVSASTKRAIGSALFNEGCGYLELFNSQMEEYLCRRCVRMGEKLHKLKEDLCETQNQLRELATSILCSMDLDSDVCRTRTLTPCNPYLCLSSLPA